MPDEIKNEVTKEEVTEQVKNLLSETLDASKKELVESFEAFKTEQLKAMEIKAGLYNPAVAEQRKALNERVRKFIAAIISHDHVTAKDMSEGTDNKGGYTVDSELNAEIQHLLTEYGVARREMTLVTLSKGDLKLNNLATDVSVYWTDEAAAKTSSDVVLGQVTLALKKIATIVPMSDELLEDTEIDIVSFLTGRIAEGLAKKEDEAFFKGDGGAGYGGFTGLLLNGSVNSVIMTGTTFASIDADDLVDMEDATPAGALAGAKYFAHRTILSYIRKLKGTDGHYIYQPALAGSPATVNGYPFVKVEAMPTKGVSAANTAFVLFGNLKKAAWVGTKGGMNVALSTEATVRNTAGNADIDLFRQDMTALRVVERIGYVVVLPTAVTVLKTAPASA